MAAMEYVQPLDSSSGGLRTVLQASNNSDTDAVVTVVTVVSSPDGTALWTSQEETHVVGAHDTLELPLDVPSAAFAPRVIVRTTGVFLYDDGDALEAAAAVPFDASAGLPEALSWEQWFADPSAWNLIDVAEVTPFVVKVPPESVAYKPEIRAIEFAVELKNDASVAADVGAVVQLKDESGLVLTSSVVSVVVEESVQYVHFELPVPFDVRGGSFDVTVVALVGATEVIESIRGEFA